MPTKSPRWYNKRSTAATSNATLVSVALLLSIASGPASAYVGPGLGVGVIAAIFGGILAVLLAVFGVFWYPIKRMLGKGSDDDDFDEDFEDGELEVDTNSDSAKD